MAEPIAFPRTGEGFGNPKYDEPGMTLRDWFAGQATFAAAALLTERGNKIDPKDLAAKAFELADAMLAARKAPEHG